MAGDGHSSALVVRADRVDLLLAALVGRPDVDPAALVVPAVLVDNAADAVAVARVADLAQVSSTSSC